MSSFSSIFKGISGANPWDPMDLAGTTGRKWEEYMSNTAHQREVEDLKKAGLNPVLSAGGSGMSGASTPSAPSGGGAELGSLIGAITNIKKRSNKRKASKKPSRPQRKTTRSL